MKKLLGCILGAAVFMFLFAAFANAADKLDLPLNMLVEHPLAGKSVLSKSVSIQSGVEQVDVLIKSLDVALTQNAIEAAGGNVRSVIGDIMTAFVPSSFLPELAGLKEVQNIESSVKMNSLMDSARANTGASLLQSAADNPDGIAYDGKNVIVGVLDTGLDYSRDDFKDAGGNGRVQYLALEEIDTSTDPATVTVLECVKKKINDGDCSIPATNDSTEGHGSHVTGIAAGSNATYKGMAPAADIMFYINSFSANNDIDEGTASYSSGLVDGVQKIFTKADRIDKPAVINISQGTHVGAHDNTSLLEQSLNSAVIGQYSSSGKAYGRAIVAAAGNENVVEDALSSQLKTIVGGIHASFDLSNGQSKALRLWALKVSSTTGGNDQRRTPLIADMWFGSDEGSNCSVAAKVYNVSSFSSTNTSDAVASVTDLPLSEDNTGVVSKSSDGKVATLVATSKLESSNSKPRAIIAYGPSTNGTWDDVVTDLSTGYFLDIIIRANGGSCSGDTWIEGALTATYTHFLKNIDTSVTVSGSGSYSMADGDSNKTVGVPATASGVIAVGAYLQEKPHGSGQSKWTDTDGTVHDATNRSVSDADEAGINGGTVDVRTPFSSIGPAAYSYSLRKPELLAPGDPVISVLPSGFTPTTATTVDSTHYKNQGTSQASPQVAGIVALLFQKNNTLTASEVKQALINSASLSSNPDNSNGYGKVNALAAMEKISADTSGYSGTGDLTEDSTPTTSTGCGGSMIAPFAYGQAEAAFSLLLILPAAVFFVYRKKRI